MKVSVNSLYTVLKLPKSPYKLKDFYKDQIVKCKLFKNFMRVMAIDVDLNLVIIYDINELSDTYSLKPYQLDIPEISEEIVELLYI